jgi:hypothetical protein
MKLIRPKTNLDNTVQGMLNSSNVISKPDWVIDYEVSSFKDMLLLIKIFTTIKVDDNETISNSTFMGSLKFKEYGIEPHKLNDTIIQRILRPLGLKSHYDMTMVHYIDSEGGKIAEFKIIDNI